MFYQIKKNKKNFIFKNAKRKQTHFQRITIYK